jgi:esterase/lipase
MMRVFRWLVSAILVTALVAAALWFVVPRTVIDPAPRFDASAMGEDLPAWLAGREAVFDDITPGAEKRIVWAAAQGVRTDWAVVYIHGFSATSEEIRPVPDEVAQALGANLFFTRLAGHGRGGAAMAAATPEDWVLDLDEALAIGRRIGDRVLVIATSTGGTLAVLAATDAGRAEGLAGVVLVSPNFRLANAQAQFLLDAPWIERWGSAVAGAERSFAPQNAEHGRWWTTAYPTAALYPMGALMRAVRAIAPGDAVVPALFIYTEGDKVVDAATTAAMAAGWGAPSATFQPQLTAQDDPWSHVIAGRILSPAQTAPVVAAILDWAATLSP